MIQEYANGFDLNVLLGVHPKLSQVECRVIIKQIAAGMKQIQALGITHRDLKPENILLHFPDNPELNTLCGW